MTSPTPHPSDVLLDYVYGELSSEEAHRVQAHVDGCTECATTIAGYRAVRGAARALPREVPVGGTEALLLAARQTAARAQRRRLAFQAGTLVTGALAAALVLLSLRPAAKPESSNAVASPPAPAAVPQGALAANEAKPVEQEVSAPQPSAPVALSAKKAKPAAPQLAKREAAPAADVAAEKSLKGATGSAVMGTPQPVVRAAPEAAASAAGAPAPKSASNARASAPADAQWVAGPAAAAQAPPAEVSAQRARDEARRQTLLLRLKDASGAEALPLLSELCTLEARLQHQPEAQAACSRVVNDYPGTPEATSAQAQLQRLGASPKAP